MHIAATMSKNLNILAIRTKLQMTRAQLAAAAGVDVSTVCRWEKKGPPNRGPARALIERLAADAKAGQAA